MKKVKFKLRFIIHPSMISLDFSEWCQTFKEQYSKTLIAPSCTGPREIFQLSNFLRYPNLQFYIKNVWYYWSFYVITTSIKVKMCVFLAHPSHIYMYDPYIDHFCVFESLSRFRSGKSKTAGIYHFRLLDCQCEF